MADLGLSKHAGDRIRQRGFREQDIEVLLRYGTVGLDGRVVMTEADVARARVAMKRVMTQIERLSGMTAIIADGRIVTIYRRSRRDRIRCRPGVAGTKRRG